MENQQNNLDSVMVMVENLKKQYGHKVALHIPGLLIKKGEGFGLVGNNGAGKTTFFRMLLDLIKPTTGQVKMKGEPVNGRDAWKTFTGSYLDEGFLIGFLTPDEYFEFVGGLYHISRAELQERLQRFEEIFNGEILGKRKYIRDLSKGNQKKVGIAAALMIEPEVAVLDEPFANLDPTTQIRLKELLNREQRERGTTLLVSSHDLNHVTDVCERIVVLKQGEMVQDIATSTETLKQLEEFFAA